MQFVFNFTHDFLLSPDLTIVSKLIAEIRKSENLSHDIWGFFSKEAVYTLFHHSLFLNELLNAPDFRFVIHGDHLTSLMPGSMEHFKEKLMENGKILERSEFSSLLSEQLTADNTCILQF
ncbi:MAG: hypothetical protein ACTSYI_13640 [Promethearchaeota archaeon]